MRNNANMKTRMKTSIHMQTFTIFFQNSADLFLKNYSYFLFRDFAPPIENIPFIWRKCVRAWMYALSTLS